MYVRSPEEGEIAPSYIVNGKIVDAFGSNITSAFGTPNYGELDPNPVVAFFYCLFFGFMFSDAAYGVILAAGSFGYILIKKPVNKSFFMMFGFCGISTLLWGIVFGSWFGENLLKFQPVNMLDATGIMLAFGMALGLGAVHLAAGYILSVVSIIKKGLRGNLGALFTDGGWAVVLIGALPLVLGIVLSLSALLILGEVVLIIGGVSLVVGGCIGKKNPIKMLMGVFKNVYGIINVFSDILSYSRMFCLGLTTGIIGMVINIIATVLFGLIPVAGYIVGIGLLILGHAMNFGVNALGCYVHDSRLQYVEFFGKFFSGSGHAFKPLGCGLKYHYYNGESTPKVHGMDKN